MANFDETSMGVYQKPFFHEHFIYVIAGGKLYAEFMNVPDLGYFVHLAKGEKERLRIPYQVAVWICEQESKLGNGTLPEDASDEVIDDAITVTRHKFRLYFPFNGFVTATEGDPWTEMTIQQNSDKEESDGEPNRIVLTRTEYGGFKRWVLRVLEDRYEEAKAREFDHGLFLIGSNHERSS